MWRVMNFSLLAKSLLVVICLERRTHTEAVWSVELTFREYWGLLPTQRYIGYQCTLLCHFPHILQLTDVIPIFFNVTGLPYIMYCGLLPEDFRSPVDVDDIIEGLQRLPVNPKHTIVNL